MAINHACVFLTALFVGLAAGTSGAPGASGASGGVKQGVQFAGKFYAWPGFDDPREAAHMTTVTRQVTTPHIKTAVPYAAGATDVLFICPRYAVRPTIELCQRFDLREHHALTARYHDLTRAGAEDFFGSPGDTRAEVLESLRAGLATRLRVIVVYESRWGLLPQEFVDPLLEMVKAGAGLVLWNVDVGSALPDGLAEFASDEAAAAARMVRFTHGDNEYVGVLRDHRMFYSEPVPILDQRPADATLDLGRTAHVYDVRARRYLGFLQQIEATIVPAEAHLYALLPYRVKAITVDELRSTERARHLSLKVGTADGGGAGTHVLQVQVQDPAGRVRREYCRNVKAEDGAAEFRLSLTLSDPAGRWRITVRDAASGVMAEAYVAHDGQFGA